MFARPLLSPRFVVLRESRWTQYCAWHIRVQTDIGYSTLLGEESAWKGSLARSGFAFIHGSADSGEVYDCIRIKGSHHKFGGSSPLRPCVLTSKARTK